MDFDHATQQPESAEALARQHTADAIQTLVDILKVADYDSARIAAANALLDRGHGKPTQAIISIPAPKAKRYKLAAMTEAELLERIERAPLPRLQSPQAEPCELIEDSQAIACDPLLD